MTSYRTCRRCAFEKVPCARRAEIADRIKGIGLTIVGFRCTQKVSLFRQGQRVSVTWPVYPGDWSYEDGYSLECWPATVLQETGKGFVVLVDDVDSDHGTPARDYIKSENLFCNVRASRLTALAEPDREVCPQCNGPRLADGSVPGCCGQPGKSGWDGYAAYWPNGCLRRPCDSSSDPQGGDAMAAPGEASQSGRSEAEASPK